MKKLLYILSGLALLGSTACKKSSLDTYSADDNIMFSFIEGADPATSYLGLYVDSIDVSFAFSGETITDTIIGIPLAVTGLARDHDRNYEVEVAPQSTAELNVHYDFPSPFIIRAGNISDTLKVRLKRDASLKENTPVLVLNLKESNDFKTSMKFRQKSPAGNSTTVSSTDTVLTQVFKISMNDKLSQGPYWNDFSYYFGDFSEKKVRLINSITGMPLDIWSTPIDTEEKRNTAIYYGGFMFRYLSDEKFAGRTIFEDDGMEMTMGSYFR